jgi:L-lactate dehydrogenase complex protein LldE
LTIALFIPCYIDQFYPHVGIATLNLLEGFGLDVHYPLNQTCCGQPMANAGFEKYSKATGELFLRNFSSYDYIVSPSGSCVMHIKEHLNHVNDAGDVPHKNFELCEFITDIVKPEKLEAHFPYKVGLHASCHGLRGLRLAKASELNEPDFNKPKSLLEKVKGIELIELSRKDECCGFGGTFAVSEEAISVRMGEDRIEDHLAHGAEVITGADMSCLMHLEGLIRRQNKNIKVMHIAEILGRND